MIGLANVRPAAAAALAPADDHDPQVLELADAVDAPCLMLTWAQPWLVPQGEAPLVHARLDVLLIGGRVDASASLEAVEDMAAFVIGRLAGDLVVWSLVAAVAPRAQAFGGQDYLAARLTYQVPVDGAVRAVAPELLEVPA